MEIAERIAIRDIEAELILVYTRARRHITVSDRLPPDKRLRLVDMARAISRDYLNLCGNEAVILIHNDMA
jgi:hypothetical protein